MGCDGRGVGGQCLLYLFFISADISYLTDESAASSGGRRTAALDDHVGPKVPHVGVLQQEQDDGDEGPDAEEEEGRQELGYGQRLAGSLLLLVGLARSTHPEPSKTLQVTWWKQKSSLVGSSPCRKLDLTSQTGTRSVVCNPSSGAVSFGRCVALHGPQDELLAHDLRPHLPLGPEAGDPIKVNPPHPALLACLE